MKKQLGIALPVFSLSGAGGIGTIGSPARDYIDFLKLAGQDLWPMLPIGPSDDTGSPYRVRSVFAGDPLLIDLDDLCEMDLVSRVEVDAYYEKVGGSARVNYALLRETKIPLLRKAAMGFNPHETSHSTSYSKFLDNHAYWISDFADYMASREPCGSGVSAEEWKRIQYFFFSQWDALRKHADEVGIGIMGDLPFYVSSASSDFVSHTKLFKTIKRGEHAGEPASYGGVPPDNYSDSGQVWDMPVYNWREHEKTSFRWWKARVAQAANMYSCLRLDHFRGFADYYEIPPNSNPSAGRWRKGPGKSIIDAFEVSRNSLEMVAEDLGHLSAAVASLRDYAGYPGMEVMQFAFEPDADSSYLPHNHRVNSMVCTGTHDNNTLRGWLEDMRIHRPDVIEYACKYFELKDAALLRSAIMKSVLNSVSETAIIPLQDWLDLGSEARINTPGTTGAGNWTFRLSGDMLTEEFAESIRDFVNAK